MPVTSIAFHAHIRSNMQLAKAQEAGTDIFNYNKHTNCAADYTNLAEEFLQKIETFQKHCDERIIIS